jgi:Flp pilus assembly protein TadG
MLVLFAFGLVVFFGAVAMSIDVGQIVVARRNLQNSADAAVLAAAQELPSTSAASPMALDYADRNANASSELLGDPGVQVEFSSTYAANDSVRVTITREVQYTFARVLGLQSTTVSATAVARVGYYNGGTGLQPWGLVADGSSPCISGSGNSMTLNYNTTCKLKDGAPGDGGDFGALRLDGSGANQYREDIEDGSETAFHVGDTVRPETGNMAGPTAQGIEARLNQPRPPGCTGETFSQLTDIAPDGSVTIVPGCEGHPRFIVIPVVDKIDHPKHSTILGFAVMFLEDVHEGHGNGHTEVYGRFINVTTPIAGGSYTGSNTSAPSTILLAE